MIKAQVKVMLSVYLGYEKPNHIEQMGRMQ